jgi:hypothetical protein
MGVKRKNMNEEAKRRRQKAVIGIGLAVLIAALFTVTIGIGMNNGDTGDGVVGMGGLGNTLTAYGNGGEATSSNDVRINGILEDTAQWGFIDVTSPKPGTQTIYEGTSGFLITIDATDGDLVVDYYVDEKPPVSLGENTI